MLGGKQGPQKVTKSHRHHCRRRCYVIPVVVGYKLRVSCRKARTARAWRTLLLCVCEKKTSSRFCLTWWLLCRWCSLSYLFSVIATCVRKVRVFANAGKGAVMWIGYELFGSEECNNTSSFMLDDDAGAWPCYNAVQLIRATIVPPFPQDSDFLPRCDLESRRWSSSHVKPSSILLCHPVTTTRALFGSERIGGITNVHTSKKKRLWPNVSMLGFLTHTPELRDNSSLFDKRQPNAMVNALVIRANSTTLLVHQVFALRLTCLSMVINS